jgi:LPS export ABC transporter protein LptC
MRYIVIILFVLPFFSCSFNYGEKVPEETTQPDIVMNELEYVRVEDGEPIVRFYAENAQRFDKTETMKLSNYSFEQFKRGGEGSDDISAKGTGTLAQIELESGNIVMNDGVSIESEEEDIMFDTASLSWNNKEYTLKGADDAAVNVKRGDGTVFVGRSFHAELRNRNWGFETGAEGLYVDKEENNDTVEDITDDPTTVVGSSTDTTTVVGEVIE